MASIPYRDIVSSSLCTFLVGPDKKEFTIHSALVAAQSKALNVLVNNGVMEEAREKCVTFEELDEETFLRFSQFAYTGSYDAAEPRKRNAEHAVIPEIAEQPNDSTTHLEIRRKVKRPGQTLSPSVPNRTKKDLLWQDFSSLHQEPQDKAATRGNLPNDDYTDVFLSHAQMYVFADYYGIVALQDMALCRLRQALMRYTLHAEGFHDICQLVEYCFSKTVDEGGQSDPLRTLVCTYAACKVEDLWKDDYFRELMDTLNEFPGRLVRELLSRLD